MNMRWARLGGALVVAAGVAFGPTRARGEERSKAGAADLSGHWRLNNELSDDDEAKARASAAGRKAHESSGTEPFVDPERGAAAGGGGRGRRGGVVGGGGRESGPSDATGDEGDPRGIRRAPARAAFLTITQTQPEIVVAELAGPTRSFYPDGRSYKADDGASHVKSLFRDGMLIVEKKSVHGWKLTEVWQLAADGQRLQVSLRFEGGSRPKLSFRHVYDRVEPSR